MDQLYLYSMVFAKIEVLLHTVSHLFDSAFISFSVPFQASGLYLFQVLIYRIAYDSVPVPFRLHYNLFFEIATIILSSRLPENVSISYLLIMCFDLFVVIIFIVLDI